MYECVYIVPRRNIEEKKNVVYVLSALSQEGKAGAEKRSYQFILGNCSRN